MAAKPCRHPRKQTLFGDGFPELLESETHADTKELRSVDAWCPDCGSLRYWATHERRRWKKPEKVKV